MATISSNAQANVALPSINRIPPLHPMHTIEMDHFVPFHTTPFQPVPYHCCCYSMPLHPIPQIQGFDFPNLYIPIVPTYPIYRFFFYWGEGSLPQSPAWGGKSMFDVCRGVIFQLLLKVPCERLKPSAKLFQSSAVATFPSRASVASAIPASAAAAACFQCRCCCCFCFRGFLGVPGRCFCQRGCFFPASLLSPITSANLVLRIPGIPSSTRPQQEAQNLNNLIGSGFVDELS